MRASTFAGVRFGLWWARLDRSNHQAPSGFEVTAEPLACGRPRDVHLLRLELSFLRWLRSTSTKVKRWRDGTMALRWCAAGMGEAAKQLRKVNGYLDLPALRVALDPHAAKTVTPANDDHQAT